jgi:hypothetical protein
MVRALRIISIVAIIAAVILLILPMVIGVRTNPEIEKRLKEPGAAEKFASAGGRSGKSEDQSSPLVKQATDFTRYLNPPPPPPPVTPAESAGRTEPAPPAIVTPKFNLIGTSYYALHPELSLALIDEPGNGLHWVREGNSIGHLKIEKVKDGSITVNDGQRTSEMTVKVEELWRRLIKDANAGPETKPAKTASSAPTKTATTGPAETPKQFRATARPRTITAQRPRTNLKGVPPLPVPPPVSIPALPAQSNNERQPVQENVEVEESPLIKEKQAQIDLLVKKLNSPDITEAEAAKLNDEIFKLIEQLGEARAAEQSTQPQSKSPPNAPTDANK